MAGAGARKRTAPLSLYPEIVRGLVRRAFRPVRVFWRRSWFYRRLLKGKLADHITFYPYDALPRRLEDADALLRGRFRFDGESVDVKDKSVFDITPPSIEWARALHGFDWLPPLSAAGGEPARTLATNLIAQWQKRNARYGEPAWAAEVITRRLIHLFAHGRFVLSSSDVLWRSKVFVGLREQARALARIASETKPGLPRLEAAAAVALSGACLDDSPKRLENGLARLQEEIAAQILPDGGHVSRSPETLVHAYRLIVMVVDTLYAIGREVPPPLRNAHDRMAPMLRFFRHGDGSTALFNGGGECHAKMIAGLLARDEVRGQPFVYAPHSGYQRLAAGRTLAIIDCGRPPKGAYSTEAHAGTLSFELSAGAQRIVVNCGAANTKQPQLEDALRGTAAHSTVTLSDTSMAAVLAPGIARDVLGPRLLGGPHEVQTNRLDSGRGWTVEASHDGYQALFGITHERRVTLATQGVALQGSDRLVPRPHARRDEVPFAARFHIHPDVRVSISQGGDILLKLANGEGWKFRGSLPVALEESIYLGNGAVRRSEQLVLYGAVGQEPVEFDWAFEQYGGA